MITPIEMKGMKRTVKTIKAQAKRPFLRIGSGIIVLVMAVFLSADQAQAQDHLSQEVQNVNRINFVVRDPKTREVYFTGYETTGQDGDMVRKETFYFDLNKKEVQYEEVVYDTKSLRVLSYIFSNKVTGEETMLKSEGETIRIRQRDNVSESYQEETMEWGKNYYHEKVLNELILRNWDSLQKGEKLKFELLIPQMFDTFGFQFVYQGRKSVDNEERAVFRPELRSFILRALAPRTYYQYSPGANPELRQYNRPCTIPIKGKEDKEIEIVYSSPASKE